MALWDKAEHIFQGRAVCSAGNRDPEHHKEFLPWNINLVGNLFKNLFESNLSATMEDLF